MNINRNALITGAGSGIGAETAIVLAKQNYHIIITGKSLSSLEKTEKIIWNTFKTVGHEKTQSGEDLHILT